MSRATYTVTAPPEGVRVRTGMGYCRLCGLYDWHWKGCDEVDLTDDGSWAS